jgi:secreted trypsin-like serine protease
VTNDRQVLLGVLSWGTSCGKLARYSKTPRSQIFTSVMAHTQEIENFIEYE